MVVLYIFNSRVTSRTIDQNMTPRYILTKEIVTVANLGASHIKKKAGLQIDRSIDWLTD